MIFICEIKDNPDAIAAKAALDEVNKKGDELMAFLDKQTQTHKDEQSRAWRRFFDIAVASKKIPSTADFRDYGVYLEGTDKEQLMVKKLDDSTKGFMNALKNMIDS